MSFCHGNSALKRTKIPPPKCSNKKFYSPRMNDSELEKLLDFGINYSIKSRLNYVPLSQPDEHLQRALDEMRNQGFSQGKIMHIIRKKMNKIKLGVECSRVCRRMKV